VQDKLRALVKLAVIDASARHIEELLEGIPVELEERRAAVDALETLVGGQKQQMDEATALLEAQVDDLKMRSDMLARSRAKGAKARNMREAEAAERELDAIRRSIRDGEAEKERLEGVIAKARETLEEPLAELEKQNAELAQAAAGVEERLEGLRKERDEITAGREEFVALVPKRFYRTYERIRPQIHPAVVEAKDGVCQGCRMAISPQLFNQIIRGDDFYRCQQCTRFLYHADVVAEPGEAKPHEAEAAEAAAGRQS